MASSNVTSDRALALDAGRRLANAAPGEEIVISGIAGFYPDSDNVADFGEKLFNKVDLISDDDRRWKLGKYAIFLAFFKTFQPSRTVLKVILQQWL